MKNEVNGSGLNQLVARQVKLWEGRRLAERQREKARGRVEETIEPYITISRQFGSCGSIVGEKAAMKLGWECFDKELVEHMASVAHVRQSVIESLDEKTMDGIQEWISTLIDRHSFDHEYYLKYLMTVLMTIARHGRAVIVGRGANFVLPPERGLRVRVIAPLEQRIAEMGRRLDVGYEETKKMVLERDERMDEFIQQQYKREVSDPAYYDMMLNTGTMRIDDCVEIIVHALRTRFKGEI
jgi:cytidylate kinase